MSHTVPKSPTNGAVGPIDASVDSPRSRRRRPQHAASPGFVYRHRWAQHDLLMWDNRCAMHVALADFDQSKTRHMVRTSLLGEPSGYVVIEAAPERESLIQALAAIS